VPDAKALKNLRDAAQNGNLFMYQRGDKYPSKWTGRDWSSMDKSWIDRSRPTEVKDLEKLPTHETVSNVARAVSNSFWDERNEVLWRLEFRDGEPMFVPVTNENVKATGGVL
jgi:hypothetical protein